MSSLHPACDAIAAQCAKVSPAGPHPTLVLITTILASALAFVDGSVVNVALPTLGKAFNGGAGAEVVRQGGEGNVHHRSVHERQC